MQDEVFRFKLTVGRRLLCHIPNPNCQFFFLNNNFNKNNKKQVQRISKSRLDLIFRNDIQKRRAFSFGSQITARDMKLVFAFNAFFLFFRFSLLCQDQVVI